MTTSSFQSMPFSFMWVPTVSGGHQVKRRTPLPPAPRLRHHRDMDAGPVDHESSDRVAVARGWLAGTAAFVITFLVVRWVVRQVWPDQGRLSDLGTDLLRVAISLGLATVAALAVARWTGRGHD